MSTQSSRPTTLDGTFEHVASKAPHLNPLARSSESPGAAKNPLSKAEQVHSGMAESVAMTRNELLQEQQRLEAQRENSRTWRDRLLGRQGTAVALNSRAQNTLDAIWAHEERCLKLASDGLYEDARERVNLWLSGRKIENRQALIVYTTEKLQQLKATLEERRAQFGELMRKRVQRLESYTDMPLLAEAEASSIREEVQKQITLLADMEAHFTNSVSERVG